MKLLVRSALLSALCLCGIMNAAPSKEEVKVTLSTCKNNLEKERAVFNKSFTKAYKGTEIETMILKKFKTLDDFLVAAFEDEETDFKNNKKDTLFIAAKNSTGDVIGFVAFDKNPDHIYIRQLAVDPEYQGKGVGAALTWAFLSTWDNCTSIKFVTRKLNAAAIAFYKKQGFDFSKYTHGSYDPNVYVGMERPLDKEFITSIREKHEHIN